MDNDEFKKPLTILVTPGMAEYLTATYQRALELARNDNFVRIEAIKTSLPINQIARPINTHLEPKRRVGSYEDFIHMNIFKGEDPEKEAAKKAVKQHKKHLATCAKNKKNRKRKNR
jgi:hypothetical protein